MGRNRTARIRSGRRVTGFTPFLDHLTKVRDVSPHTIIAYEHDLSEFTTYLGSYYADKARSCQGVDPLAIRGFMAYLTRKGLGKRSIARALSAVRSYYKYMHRNEEDDVNPARGVGTPKLEKRMPGYLDRQQTGDLFALAETRAQSGRFV